MYLDDLEFIREIEGLTLNPEYFNHEGHIRLAWLYLAEYELDIAIEKTCTTIQAYAKSLGAATKFHKTITAALVNLMHKRSKDERSWQEFVFANKELIENCYDELLKYYDESILKSDEARLRFLEPNLSKW